MDALVHDPVFEEDGLNDYDYRAVVEREAPVEPEKLLMTAIIKDALCCYKTNFGVQSTRKKIAWEDAEAWIFETDDDRFLSFESICGALGIHATGLRLGIARWRKGKEVLQ